MGKPDLFRLAPDTDLVEHLLALPPEARADAVGLLGSDERDALDRDWPSWAHAGQAFPSGDWSTWVVMAGRGFGKTLTGSNWITAAIAGDSAYGCPPSGFAGGQPNRLSPSDLRIALVGATLEDARRVMVEGRSGLLAVADAWVDDWNPSLRRLRFRTGAEATLFSGASPEMLRGPEHHLAWCDELAKWEQPQETWDMLQLGLRLGTRPRALVTTTPRPGPVLKAIMAEDDTTVTGGPTDANPHASPAWLAAMHRRYGGTRLGRQELGGELLADHPGALWSVELLERCRIPLPARDGEILRIVIAVDPPALDGTCGIIACARDEEGNGHVLADHSVTARTPEGWARAVADAAQIHSSPRLRGEGAHAQHGGGATSIPVLVVAEKNQGGRMVEAVLRTADPDMRIRPVTATLPKSERAEPVAHLFEAGRVFLHGRFPELEAQLCGIIAGGDYQGPGKSPDRADAMVWALTELLLTSERAPPRIRAL